MNKTPDLLFILVALFHFSAQAHALQLMIRGLASFACSLIITWVIMSFENLVTKQLKMHKCCI